MVFAAALCACSDAPPADDPPGCPDAMFASDDGTCTPAECSPDSCARGVCEPAQGCVSAGDCAGDDARCLTGSFCADDDTCQPSLCGADSPECTRGVCDPATGQCDDVETCESSRECQPGSRCLGDECVPEAKLCGESGCPEGRVCDYRELTNSAECVEVTPCQTSRDCFEGRVCAGSVCMSPPVCEPDTLEPNEDQSAATDFDIVSNQDAVDATLCGDDRDVYRLEVGRPEDDTGARRELLVRVEFPRREVGLGRLSAALVNPDGDTVADETSDEDGNISINHPLSLANTGTYHVVIETDASVATGGLHYRLVARDLPLDLENACQRAPSIELGESISGNTAVPDTQAMGSRCSAGPMEATELHVLDIDEPSQIDVRLTTNNPQNFITGLRSDCRRLDTELACTVGEQTRFGSSNRHVQLDDVVLGPGRYFITVQNPDGQDGEAYELLVSTSEADCDPAADSCTTPDGSRTCDPTTGSWDYQRCANGCQTHDGHCRPQMADTCDGAPLLRESGTLQIDWEQLSGDYFVPEGSCLPSINRTTNTKGPDAVYQVALPAMHALSAKLTTGRPHDVSIYLLDDCLSPGDRCLAGTNAEYVDTEELLYWNDSPSSQSLFLVVDAVEGTRGLGEFTASIDPILCEQWESRCHDGDLQSCTTDRTGWNTIAECQWGCANSSCNPPPGDTCAAAEPLAPGQTFSGVFSDYANSASSIIDQCVEFGSIPNPGYLNDNAHEGPDAYFSVQLSQGDLLTANLTTNADASLFVADSCQPSADQSCLFGDESSNSLEFYAPQTATYYLAADTAEAGATAGFDLSIDVQSGTATCQPGGTYCDPGTGELVICNDQGTRETGRRTCPNGCAPQACQAPASLNDTCGSAYHVAGSARIVDDLNRFADDYGGASSCGVNNTDEADAVYQIDLNPNEVLQASVQGKYGDHPSMYVVADCTDLEGTCRAGSTRHTTGGSPDIEYLATSQETVFLIVDCGSVPNDGQILLDIEVRPVQCQFGETRCATVGGMDYCSELGLWEPYFCQGGCTTGECATPRGGICQDAILVSDGQTVTGDWSGENNLELGGLDGAQTDPGLCQEIGPANSVGEDTFYRVELQQGDLLEVTVDTPNQYATVHFLESCTGTDTCQPSAGTHAFYYAETSRPVWVMVDASRQSTSSTYNPTYTASFNVISGAVCVPGKASCLDSTTVELCNAQGTAIAATYNCPGTCAQGACQADLPNADTCAGAPNIGDGILVYANPWDLTDDVTFGQQSCTGNNADLPDLVYEVTVAANEVLRVKSSSGVWPILIDDCADPDGTCFDFQNVPTNPFGLEPDGQYWSPQQTRTIKVVADVYTSSEPVRLQIDKLPVECSPGARQCSQSADAVLVCEPWGLWRSTDCQTTCSSGRCDVPSGEYCEDPIVLSPGMSVAGSFGDFNDDVSLYNSGCTSLDGNDAVYEMALTAGDILDARLLAPAGATLSAMQGCSQSGFETCLGSSMGERDLTFVAPSSGTYYLVVADESSHSDGDDFVLEVDLHNGGPCTPGSEQCVDSDTLEHCPNGHTVQRECEFGCNNGACSAPTNDACGGAVTIPRDGAFHTKNVNLLADYTDTVNVGSTINSCPVFGTPGPDAIYRFDAQAGDVFTAYWPSRREIFGWLTSDCSDASHRCVDASRQGYLEETIPTTGTYWFVLDSDNQVLDETIPLDVRLAPTICQPGQSTCDTSTGVISYCNAAGTGFKDYACHGGCDTSTPTTQPRCLEPRGEQCVDAVDASQGGSFSVDVQRFDDTFSETGTTCVPAGADGGDVIYRVELGAGDTVEAAVTPPQGDAAVVFILSDCHTSDPESACLTSASPTSGQTVSASYTATSAETVYVVVDSTDRSASAAWSVDISVR